MVLSCASILLALSVVFGVLAHRFERSVQPKFIKSRNAQRVAWHWLPTKIRCEQLRPTRLITLPVNCESTPRDLYLHGNTVSDACVLRSRDAFKILFRPTGPSCSGSTKLSSTRTAVFFDGTPTPLFCCLCPPLSIWSRLNQACVCPTLEEEALLVVNGRCPVSRDSRIRHEAHRSYLAGSNKLVPLDESFFTEEPARQEIHWATSWCKAQREIDELAPAAKYHLAPIRMGFGMEVPAVGFLNGVVIETLHVSRLSAEIKLDKTSQGIKVSLSPGKEGESLRVGIDKVTLYIDGEAITMQHAHNVRADGSGGKYLIQVGGTLAGEDLLENLITYRSSVGLVFKQTYGSMAPMKTNGLATKLFSGIGLKVFKAHIKEAIEWFASDFLSRYVFALIGNTLQDMTLSKIKVPGIDTLPLTMALESTPVNPAARHILDLSVSVTQGRTGVPPEISPGITAPEVSASFVAEGDDLSFDVSAGIKLDSRRLLHNFAEDWNLAALADATEGKLYSDTSEEQQAAKEATAEEDSHSMLMAILRAALGTANFLSSLFVEPPSVREPIPVDPSKERLAMEEYLLKSWKAQTPKSVGTMSRVLQGRNPYYIMYSLEDIETVAQGSLKAVAEASGEAMLSGTLNLSKFVLKGLAIDMVEPLPCHTRQDCNHEKAAWRPYLSALSQESLYNFSIETPLPVSVGASMKHGVVDLSVAVKEDVALASNSSWIKLLANYAFQWVSLRSHVEKLIQIYLKDVVSHVFAQLQGTEVRGFSVELNLNSAEAVHIETNGESRYSSLGDLQLLAAAVPPYSLREDEPEDGLPGHGWTALKARLDQNATISGAAVEKYSIEPRDWLGLYWALAVNNLLHSLDLKVHLDPTRAEFFGHIAGSVSLDIPALVRAGGNHGLGAFDCGGHVVGLGHAVFVSGRIFGRSGNYDAVVSCGSIYFASVRAPGKPGEIVNRAIRRLTAAIAGTATTGSEGGDETPNFLQVGDHSCRDGTAYGVKPRRGLRRAYKFCVATNSSLDLAIMYELERARLVEEMLAQRTYAASAPWRNYRMKTAPFDWSYHIMPFDLCQEEMRRCADHLPCQGVQLNDKKACEFLSFKEIDRLKTMPSAHFAFKRWQVGPVRTWGAEARG